MSVPTETDAPASTDVVSIEVELEELADIAAADMVAEESVPVSTLAVDLQAASERSSAAEAERARTFLIKNGEKGKKCSQKN